jgi:LPS O-antigen subunit length determinant protein (WzzB/FepE family)
VGFLEQELTKTTAVETRQAIARLMEAQINQRMIANVTKQYAFRVADKAMPSDRRDMVRPNKLLLFALGPTLGFSFGAIIVLLFGSLRRSRAAPI